MTHYVGTIASNGSTFGSSLVRSVSRVLTLCLLSDTLTSLFTPEYRGSPFVTEIGVGKLIKGWDEGTPPIFLVCVAPVALLMVADMVRCPSANARLTSDIESIAGLRACRAHDRCL